MKCPKCGYLGFETTDRCRNCQYDFSLAPISSDPELTLHDTDRKPGPPVDFDLPPIGRPGETLSATALDLDRLFGEPEPRPQHTLAPPAAGRPEPVPVAGTSESPVEVAAVPADDPLDAPLVMSMDQAAPERLRTVESREEVPEIEVAVDQDAAGHESMNVPVADDTVDDAALPFDDAPLVPPPAARPPLAVRRSTPEVPRNRPRTTRPVRSEPLNLESQSTRDGGTALAAGETVASLMEQPSIGVRVGAGLIDVLLLVTVDAAVLYLTLRITGLQNTLDDLRVLPRIPLVGFLAMLGFGYVAAFTVAGGQTIGKMALSLRVIGDDGRPVDAAGGVLRALGCMLVPITLGLSYLPALFTSDHRALHDRLAGTRVVQE